MSRRSTPERLHHARRSAIVERLVGDGERRDRAEALASAWETKADADGLDRDGRYWDAGWRWIAANRS